MTKEELYEMLYYVYDEPLNANLAWDVYNRFIYHIDNGDVSTINYFLKIMIYDECDILKLRNKMAEGGRELTPEQLSQYIFILNLCIMDKINR